MRITALRLTNFKRHRRLDLEFGPGLNVVRGANEAGKSTIQRALEMGFFRRPTFASQELQDLASWGVPEASTTVKIEFEDDGKPGYLRKDFAGAQGTVELNYDDEQLTDPAAVEQRIAALTGLPSEKFYRATASIHHQELTGLSQDEGTLRDRLQQSMSGADKGTHTARRKLEEAIRRYRTEGAKNPGYLKVLHTNVDRLREQVGAGEKGLEQLETDRRTLADARTARATIEVELAEQQAGLVKAERAVALATEGAEATRRYNHYRRAVELREEIGRLDASHPTTISLPVLRSTVEHLRDLEFRLSEMRAELAAEPDLSGYDVAIPTPRWQPWLIVGLALLVGGLGAVAFALINDLGLIVLAVGGALAVGGGLALFETARQRRRLTDIRMQNELRESEIARRLAGRTDLAERVRAGEQERAEALASLGQDDLPAAETVLAAQTEHAALIATRQAEYRGLMGDEPGTDDVGELRDTAAAEADQCRHSLAGLGENGREPQRHLLGYQRAVQRLGPERDAAIQSEANASARLDANDVDAEKVAVDVEALASADEALAAAERRLRIYEEALLALNNAERGTMKKAARYLEQSMARDIERVTGGRYRRLRVDEDSLTFSVHSPELGEWVDVRRLSQGTLDQLYLCARLGIVRQVTEPARPPLVLDDPFVTFDDERATRAIELLKDVARDFQVILLTCTERYDKLADRLEVLSAPVERDEPEPIAEDAQAEPLAMWSSTTLPPPAGTATGQDSVSGTADQARAAGTAAASAAPSAKPASLWPEER
jgi:DNA repair exonuclease SbcCD ATPase subunit